MKNLRSYRADNLLEFKQINYDLVVAEILTVALRGMFLHVVKVWNQIDLSNYMNSGVHFIHKDGMSTDLCVYV